MAKKWPEDRARAGLREPSPPALPAPYALDPSAPTCHFRDGWFHPVLLHSLHSTDSGKLRLH